MPNKHGKTPIIFDKRKNSHYGRIGAGYFKVIKEIHTNLESYIFSILS